MLAFEMLNHQAERLLDEGDFEAADTLFAVLQKDVLDEDPYLSQLEKAYKALESGDSEAALALGTPLLKTRSDIRKKAALVVAKALDKTGRRDEAVSVLETAAKNLPSTSAVPLILLAIDISPKSIVNREQMIATLTLSLRGAVVRPDLDQAIIKLLAMTGEKAALATYLIEHRQGEGDPERLRRAAELFSEVGEAERTASILESLYRETDAIEDLVLLADALKSRGRMDKLIDILEEKSDSDSRIARMLHQELAVYSAQFEDQRVVSDTPEAVESSRETPNFFDDSGGGDVEVKLHEAFDILRKKE
jgi:tetratricopeptide (TPR) repeat protein